ncbi:MAG TPA: hypothetical protein VEQ42_02305, partial [Pyrinomonadaceae bacterium]|nr:hypothetical protein [Pyrinomonadaceae bacterium]
MDWFTKLDAPSVFIASPGELASLRESIRQEVEALAGRLADGVKPYAWEFEKSKTGFDHWRPLTTQIPLPASRYCRALICVFGERIGTPISRSRDFPLEVVGDWGRGEAPEPHLVYPWREGAELEGGFALTGTVFEYFVAMAANERRGLPRKGAPPVLLMFVGDAEGLERGGRLEAGGVGPRPTGGAEARERRSQLRQLQNFLRYVMRSRGRDCSFVDSEQQALQKTHAFLEGVLGLDETRDGFKGLQFYDVDDESVFFGRAALIDYALDKFGQLWTRDGLAPFFGLFGGSGAGKSSLLRAGLLSRLLRQTWRGYFDCAVVTANEIASGLDDGGAPSHDSASPLGVVCAKALSAVSDADGLAEAGATPRRAAHEGGPEAAVGRLVEALDAGRWGGRRRLVIGLDQFEQLIDYRAEPEKRERLEPLFRFFEAAVASRRIGFIYTCQPNRRQLIEQDAVLRSLVSRGDEVEVL